MATLHTLRYSPWSERARWVLLHHGLSFHERDWVPFLLEPVVRARHMRFRGRISAPMFEDGDALVVDSLAIAEHVERTGKGAPLFPPGRLDAIRSVNASVEPFFHTGRALAIRGIDHDNDAAVEALPRIIREVPGAATWARLGSRLIAMKYGTSFTDIDARMREGLAALRTTLGGRAYVFDKFTYADIIVATAIQFVQPVNDRYIPLEPATRRRWTHAIYASEFSDLVTWRDALYEMHRPMAADA